MMDKTYANAIVKRVQNFAKDRRELQGLSSDILGASKRAIFAMHREDLAAATKELDAARAKIKLMQPLIKRDPRLDDEGMWHAAQEEFAEASLLAQYLDSGKIGPVKEIGDDPDLFIGALSDFTGELVRRAVLLGSQRKQKEVERIFVDVSEAIEFLLRMDLTGNLRSKLDQAKQNLRKLEEIRYDLSLRAHV
jgi:predicted translin family RNA/ssDNA-binding protein